MPSIRASPSNYIFYQYDKLYPSVDGACFSCHLAHMYRTLIFYSLDGQPIFAPGVVWVILTAGLRFYSGFALAHRPRFRLCLQWWETWRCPGDTDGRVTRAVTILIGLRPRVYRASLLGFRRLVLRPQFGSGFALNVRALRALDSITRLHRAIFGKI